MAVFCKFYKNALIRVSWHAELISALKTEPKPMFLRNMQKTEKNIYYHYFLFFVIFSKSFKQKVLILNESCLDGKKANIAKLVNINFLANSVIIARLCPVQ